LRGRDICNIALIAPGLLCLVAYLICVTIWPTLPWVAILGAGYFVNVLGCLASVMRALGSVQVSMALRDAGPQIALGLAGVVAYSSDPGTILRVCAIVMGATSVAGALWISTDNALDAILCRERRNYWSMSQWGSSVLGMVVAQVDLIVGGAVISAEQLGVYAVLRRVANLVALPVTVATWVSAPAISKAYGAGNFAALTKASREASQIAALPGAVLFALGVISLPLLPVILPALPGANPSLVFGILLLGALSQVIFAASLTVATLCGASYQAMATRLLMVVVYLLWFLWWGPELSALTNALGYSCALTLGGGALWVMIKRRIGVDTSAGVLLNGKGGLWKTS
jgi:O-antigen/teichoic acid export membrane protein